MANFNPPDSHWASDFDARLAGTFHHLKERCEALEARVAELEAGERAREAALRQAVADAKFFSQGRLA